MKTKLLLNRIRRYIFRKKLSGEAYCAYLGRLPKNIEVNWEKDGKFIIGKIKEGKEEYFTQGTSVEDFIYMVNDAVYTYHEIPVEYIEAISKAKPYIPNPEAMEKLENSGIKKSSISLFKRKSNCLVKVNA